MCWHHCSVGFSIVITCVIHSVDYEGSCILYTVDRRDWWRLLADGSLLPTELLCAPGTNCKQNVQSSSNIISCALENIHCDFIPHNRPPFSFRKTRLCGESTPDRSLHQNWLKLLSTAFKGKARSRFDWWWLILASTTPTSNWSYPLFPTVLMLYQTPLDRTRSLEMRTSDPWKWRLRRDSGCIETKVKLSQFW